MCKKRILAMPVNDSTEGKKQANYSIFGHSRFWHAPCYIESVSARAQGKLNRDGKKTI